MTLPPNTGDCALKFVIFSSSLYVEVIFIWNGMFLLQEMFCLFEMITSPPPVLLVDLVDVLVVILHANSCT